MTKQEKEELARRLLRQSGQYTEDEIAEILRYAFGDKRHLVPAVDGDVPPWEQN